MIKSQRIGLEDGLDHSLLSAELAASSLKKPQSCIYTLPVQGTVHLYAYTCTLLLRYPYGSVRLFWAVHGDIPRR